MLAILVKVLKKGCLTVDWIDISMSVSVESKENCIDTKHDHFSKLHFFLFHCDFVRENDRNTLQGYK